MVTPHRARHVVLSSWSRTHPTSSGCLPRTNTGSLRPVRPQMSQWPLTGDLQPSIACPALSQMVRSHLTVLALLLTSVVSVVTCIVTNFFFKGLGLIKVTGFTIRIVNIYAADNLTPRHCVLIYIIRNIFKTSLNRPWHSYLIPVTFHHACQRRFSSGIRHLGN